MIFSIWSHEEDEGLTLSPGTKPPDFHDKNVLLLTFEERDWEEACTLYNKLWETKVLFFLLTNFPPGEEPSPSGGNSQDHSWGTVSVSSSFYGSEGG